MNGKVIRKNADGTQVLVQPTYLYAMKMATMKGAYKYTRWLAVLLAAATVLLVILINNGTIAWSSGSWPKWVMGVLILFAMIFFFAKPSQVMVNNETWVDIPVWEKAVREGTEGQFFKRYWE